MATIIAIICAVIVDRYIKLMPGGQVLQRARSTAWLNAYLGKLISFLDKINIKQSYLVVLSAIVPICIALLCAKFLIAALLGERIGQFVFSFLVVFYFLGNNEVEDQESVFVIAHETSFGVLFWFAILGFSGAFLYWFFAVAKQTPVVMDNFNSGIQQALKVLHALAAWIPARITGLIYALMGNFAPTYKCWLNCMRNVKLPGSQVLQECGQVAVDPNVAGDDARLVSSSFVGWVILVLLIVAWKAEI